MRKVPVEFHDHIFEYESARETSTWFRITLTHGTRFIVNRTFTADKAEYSKLVAGTHIYCHDPNDLSKRTFACHQVDDGFEVNVPDEYVF